MKKPKIAQTAFVAPGAAVVGDVQIGEQVSIWYNAVLRGDINYIRVGNRSNVQDNCVLHVTHELPVEIGEEVTIGHGAILHGCKIGNNALIGMGAIVLDGAEVGEGALLGAGALLPPGKKIPPFSIAVGNPAVVKRELSPQELESIKKNMQDYVELTTKYNTKEE